jgi:flavodoxin I
MKAIVFYDSTYGNTEQVAKAIGNAFGAGEIGMFRVREANYNDIGSVPLLIIGSPTNGGRMTPDLKLFIEKIPDTFIKGKKVAAFDTRLKNK